jgi:hypothetical protein
MDIQGITCASSRLTKRKSLTSLHQFGRTTIQNKQILVIFIKLYAQNLVLATAVVVVQLSDVDVVQKHNEFTSRGHALLEPEQL